jgi:hypothetical protein
MAAGSTYTPIATTTLGSAQASVTFSSLGSYTDLIVVLTPMRVTSDTNTIFRFNGDSGNNYSATAMYGDGSSAASYRLTSYAFLSSGYTTANQQTQVVQIMNYGNTTTHKTALVRQSNTGSAAQAIVGRWANTAAITSIVFSLENGTNFATGSTFTLYGIEAA